jgi:hypothetical protein
MTLGMSRRRNICQSFFSNQIEFFFLKEFMRQEFVNNELYTTVLLVFFILSQVNRKSIIQQQLQNKEK